MSTFNPFPVIISFLTLVKDSLEYLYDVKTDEVAVKVSVGKGQGSSKLVIADKDAVDLVEAMEGWDPSNTDHETFTPAQVFLRTANRDEEGNVSFKTSLQPNSRTITVPAGEWNGFVGFISDAAGRIGDARSHYRSVIAQQEASVAEAAAKAAAAGTEVKPPARRGRPPKVKPEAVA